ncbi:hypothetical protein F4678DRAFT_114797 [Xylaria arbuscula]|nr:hypothetical protein F4678DRAFT_114797 [Xylaria arbuscula]
MDDPSSAVPVFLKLKQVGEIYKTFTEHMRLQWTGETVDGRKYVRTRRLVQWMKAVDPDSTMTTTTTNGSLLLEYAYELNPMSSSVFRPIEWEQISDANYIIMFGFLVDLGYGHLIDIFRRFSYQDNYLHKPGHITKGYYMLSGSFKDSASLQSFMDIFERRRWEFCPVQFYQDMDIDLDDGPRVLPFCRRQRINNKGATAHLYEVAVEEDFVNEDLREAIEYTKFNDEDFGTCYRFAFKSYSEEWKDIYKSERNAFHGIKYEKNMIKCLGTVECAQYPQTSHCQGTNDLQRCYNILLEFGEDDLNEYFLVYSPPTLGREIIDFWENLFQVVDALQRVHNLEQKRKDGTTDWYMGCHADVKPDNILRVQGSFKLADFGFATFVPCGVGHLSPVGGTETYGAPEFFQKDKVALGDGEACILTNTIDTWSIACVLSVAVTWVTLGSQGIKQFETVRQAVIEKVKSHPETTTAHDLCGDTFHDGSSVLENVTNWHHYLRRVMRKSDPISSEILDLIDEEVFGQDGDSRLTSAALYERLSELLATAKDMDEQIAESIIECIVSFDKRAPSTMKEYSNQRREEAEKLIQLEADGSKHSNKSASLTNIGPAKVAHRHVLDRPNQSSLTNRSSYYRPVPNHDSSAYDRSITALSSTQGHDPRYLSRLRTSTGEIATSTPIYKQHLSFDDKKRLFNVNISNWLSPKKDEFLSNFIQDRDFIFIVDDGTSMKRHWKWATKTLQVLAEKVVNSDEDGVDLIFTFAKDLSLSKVRKPWGKFDKAMSRAGGRISTGLQKPLATDMARVLGEVFQNYEKRLTKQRTTLIILTDGVWEGSVQSNDVEEKIACFFKDSKRKGFFEDREFTIQFVSFGDQATSRLDSLDNDMPENYDIPDAIDHEPWTGNPDKMIIGSLNEQFDKIETGSPVNQQDMPGARSPISADTHRRWSEM